MKKYLSFFKIRFINGLQYRAAAWAGVATQFVWGFFTLLMFRAFYKSGQNVFPMSFSQLSNYIWLQQAFLALFMAWFFDYEIFDAITTGNIAYELCRPLDIYTMWYVKNMAVRLSRAVLRCLPILIIAVLLPKPLNITLPHDPLAGLLFLVSIFLEFSVLTAFFMLLYISAFYTLSPTGIRILATSVIEFFAGVACHTCSAWMKLYFKYVSMLLKCQMQYKASFVMTATGQFLVSFTAFLGIYFMFTRFHYIEGFTFEEVLLCFAIVLMAFAITECFVRGFDIFPHLIRTGQFDRIMVRPRNEMFQVLTSYIEFTRLGRLIQSILVLCYAIPASSITWTSDKILTLIFMLVGGIVTFSALFVLSAGICFFTIESLEFMNIFTDGGREFGKYPFSIYGEGVLKFFTYVIPLALFQYYPFLYLTGKSDDVRLMFLPFVGFVFMIPCYAFFRLGVQKYKSTGS